MWKKLIVVTICCASLPVQSSENIMPGKKLHDDANCMRCHAKLGYHTDKTTRMHVESLPDLKRAVTFCNNNLNTGWFDDEIDEVVQYLNQTYYKFNQ